MPKRGAVALVTTILSVLLLFAFKPADQAAPPSIPPVAVVDAPTPVAGNPTPTPVVLGPQPVPTEQPSGGGTLAGGTTPTPAPTPSPTDQPAGGGSTGTFTGDAIRTFFGTVQIALQVKDGQIIDVQELQMPNDRRLSAQISQYAGPILRDQVLTVQSADINGVSGASYTSFGFYKSLQSALAKMG